MKRGCRVLLSVVFMVFVLSALPARGQETGRLALDVSPEPAEVFIDGKKYAEGSGVFKLPTGDHVVEVRKAGYETQKFSVFIGPDAVISPIVTLRPIPTPTPKSGSTPVSGKTITNSLGMEFVLMPAGEFWMGCQDDPFTAEPECGSNETPRHKVVITQPFYLGRTEVTQEQWYKVMGNNPAVFKTEKVGMNSRNHPVEMVSWEDAQEFIRRLNTKEGTDAYRLPTEAEWEYACRAGTETDYYFGNDPTQLGEHAWYDGNSGSKTHAVGQLKPNPWGLYDMHGNVWEWVADTYHDSYNGAPDDGSLWGNLGNEKTKVLRGGSWITYPAYVRSANRFIFAPGYRYNLIGVRLVHAR